MGKRLHLNPVLYRVQKKNPPLSEERKQNRTKLHDVKIPVSERMEEKIRSEALKFHNGSKTKYSTVLFMYGLDNLFEYPEVTYEDGPIMVHLKIGPEEYQRLGEHAIRWKVSMRKAAHRIFMEAAKKKQIGVIE